MSVRLPSTSSFLFRHSGLLLIWALGLCMATISLGKARTKPDSLGVNDFYAVKSISAAPTATISLSITPATVAICSGGNATLSLAGCPAAGKIQWASGQTTASITVRPTQTTTYEATCSVTGPQGTTTATANSTVTVNQPISIVGSPVSQSACENSTVVFEVSANGSGISYSWTRNGAAIAGANSPRLSLANVQGSQAGTYAVALTNQCGTVNSASAQLLLSPGVTIGATPSPAVCAGTSTGQIFATSTGGTGPRQYLLNGQGGQESNIFTNLKAGTYQVSVKDVIGCSAQTTVTITDPKPLILTVKAVNAKCSGGSDGGILVAASGGNSPYRFQINGGPLQTGESFLDLKDKGTYVVTAVDGVGCTTSQTAVIGAPQSFDIKATIALPKCAGSSDGTINVSSTGGTGAYQYQLGTGPFQAGTLFTGLSAKTYDITVKDGNGCLGTKSFVVSEPRTLSLTAAVIPVNCFGDNSGSITLTPSGGTGSVQYQLTTTAALQKSNLFKNLAVGNYTVVGTDSNGCTALLPVTIGKADPLKVQASTVAATCCVCPTGSVALTSGGGTGTGRQFQLIGRGYQVSNQFPSLPPGTYRFRVSDEVGCTDSVTAVVTDAAALSLSPGTIKNVACAGGRDGEATVQVTGGTKPFTFYWQTEQRDTLQARTQSQKGLAEGTYTVSVLDSNRCATKTTFVTISALAPIPPQPVITQTSTTLSVADVLTGIQWYVKVDTSAGKPVPNANQPTLLPFQSGSYYVVVTQGGCASLPSNMLTFILTAAEPVGDLSIRVVPNPIVDKLRIEIEQTKRQPIQLQLLDGTGRVVGDYQMPAFTGKQQAEWTLSGVSSGLYLLKAEAGDRKSVIRVLVQ